MSSAVWKFPIRVTADLIALDMPKGAAVLTVQVQNGSPVIWALVDPEAELSPRTFRLAGTGHPISEDIEEYIGTYQLFGGSLALHLFEINPS